MDSRIILMRFAMGWAHCCESVHNNCLILLVLESDVFEGSGFERLITVESIIAFSILMIALLTRMACSVYVCLTKTCRPSPSPSPYIVQIL